METHFITEDAGSASGIQEGLTGPSPSTSKLEPAPRPMQTSTALPVKSIHSKDPRAGVWQTDAWRRRASKKKQEPRRRLWRLLETALALLRGVAEAAAVALRTLRYRVSLKSLQGQVVLVTGAGQGLGRQLALQFSSCGCQVICVDSSAAESEETAQLINSRLVAPEQHSCRAYSCDVLDARQVRRLADAAAADFGRVDMLVNCSHAQRDQSTPVAARREAVDAISNNFMVHFWTLLAFLPGMVNRGRGHVVNVCGLSGLVGPTAEVPPTANKLAVTSVLDAVAEEMDLDSSNIKVTCVHPYFIESWPDLPENIYQSIPDLTLERMASEIVTAVRQDTSIVTVPRNLLFWLNVLGTRPLDYSNLWHDVVHWRGMPSAEPVAEAAPAQPVATQETTQAATVK